MCVITFSHNERHSRTFSPPPIQIVSETVAGMDADRAELISRKARTLGFALVGIWSQKTAAQYADALRNRGLVVDVSPE